MTSGFGSRRLDGFVAFLLNRVQYARRRGIPQFKLTHANGDLMFVTLTPPDGVTVIRRFPKVDGKAATAQFRLQTTETELRLDLARGISSKTAELYRG